MKFYNHVSAYPREILESNRREILKSSSHYGKSSGNISNKLAQCYVCGKLEISSKLIVIIRGLRPYQVHTTCKFVAPKSVT